MDEPLVRRHVEPLQQGSRYNRSFVWVPKITNNSPNHGEDGDG